MDAMAKILTTATSRQEPYVLQSSTTLENVPFYCASEARRGRTKSSDVLDDRIAPYIRPTFRDVFLNDSISVLFV